MSGSRAHWDRVPIKIGQRDLYIRFSLAATTRLQNLLGVKTLREVTALIDKLNPKLGEQSTEDWILDVDLVLFGTVLWAGLLECLAAQRDTTTTKDDITASIQLQDIPRILPQLVLAMSLQFIPPPAEPDNPDPLSVGTAAPTAQPPTSETSAS